MSKKKEKPKPKPRTVRRVLLETLFEIGHSYRVTFASGLASIFDGAALAQAQPFFQADVVKVQDLESGDVYHFG